MGKSFIQPGEVLEFTAPTGGVTVGVGVLIGDLFVVPLSTALATVAFEGMIVGVHSLPKVSTEVWTKGMLIYWDTANARSTSVASAGSLIGAAADVAANPSSTGSVRLDGVSASRVGVVTPGSPAPTSLATAGAETYTAAMLLSGVIVRDPAGASRTDTLATAAQIVAAVPGAKVGDMVKVWVVNGADAAEVITLAAGAGGAFDVNQVTTSRSIGQGMSKMVHIRLTNVTAASEAYVVYA